MEIVGYHGTQKESAENIIKNNFNMPDNNYGFWLGKGVYFFVEDIFAFKWCIHEYKKIYKKVFSKDDIDKMSILKVDLEYEEDRILDLTYFKGQYIFDSVYKEIMKSDKYKEILENHPKDKVCIVLDYMFDILDFYKFYDIIKQMYRINIKNYNRICNSREQGLPQIQLCVKNLDIIKNIELFDYFSKFDEYIEKWNSLINTENLIDVNIVQDNVYDFKIDYNHVKDVKYIEGDKNE